MSSNQKTINDPTQNSTLCREYLYQKLKVYISALYMLTARPDLPFYISINERLVPAPQDEVLGYFIRNNYSNLTLCIRNCAASHPNEDRVLSVLEKEFTLSDVDIMIQSVVKSAIIQTLRDIDTYDEKIAPALAQKIRRSVQNPIREWFSVCSRSLRFVVAWIWYSQ